ncbi:MAG: TIGR00159 family protein [Bacteroidetes bacterium]|nr:TIGR00159 family protein [Bacteroidota bacterium]
MHFLLLFISFRWVDAIDIFLVAVLLYQLYHLVKGTPAVSVFFGILTIYVVGIVVRALDMKLFGSILGKFIDVGVIAIIVVFQQELRRFLLFIGSNEFLGRSKLMGFLIQSAQQGFTESQHKMDFTPLVQACFNMSASKTGALIVLARHSDLTLYINSGEPLDSTISERMLENIFFKNSPLHDGAVIIKGNRIIAARCILPVTEKEQFPAHFGMRHRALVGITESTDAVAVSVSEQTGAVSISVNGTIRSNLYPEKLKQYLEHEFTSKK